MYKPFVIGLVVKRSFAGLLYPVFEKDCPPPGSSYRKISGE